MLNRVNNFTICIILHLLIMSRSNCDSKQVESDLKRFYYREKTIEVPLDHFNYVTNKTFELRYLINDTFAVRVGQSPIFFYTGNEGDIELFAENTGFLWEIAPHFNAMIVFAEHRYYGKSLPFGNASFDSPENFGYLTAEQALADYAQLSDFLTEGRNDRPVIAFGGSYGGMLAAWFRMKYPHHVAGALAASAPIWQFETLTPCDIFAKIVTSVFRTSYTPYCSANIEKSWTVFINYSSTDQGRNFLNNRFNFCKPLAKPDDINKFLDYLEDVYGNLAMANYPYKNDFLAPLPANPVRQFCFYLAQLHEDKDLIETMQSAISVYANFTGNSKCLDYQSAYEPSLGGNAWEIQTCNEMVMPMCSNIDNTMFRKKEWSLKEYSNNCFKNFGIRPREKEILYRFGGKNLGSASNIIFSNGLLDPWSGGGVLQKATPGITVIIIPEGAHHIDLRSSNPDDPVSVRKARKLEKEIIGRWIINFYKMNINSSISILK